MKYPEMAVSLAVRRAEAHLAPDVVRIRYSFGEDHSGDRAIFFRVLLTDRAAQEERLHATAIEAQTTLIRMVDPHLPEWIEVHLYFNFRSVSEQLQLKDAEWE